MRARRVNGFVVRAVVVCAGLAAAAASIPMALHGQFHRAEQDREITYWLLEPTTHQFKISHDLTIDRPGQKYAHSFVRKGSAVDPNAKMFDVDTGKELRTYTVSGKDVNALGYYPQPSDPDTVVVQGDLDRTPGEGQSVRVRVVETYTDAVGYTLDGGELVWKRTLGRPMNIVTLPAGWELTGSASPAIVSTDSGGRVRLSFLNDRDDQLPVKITARRVP